MNIELREVKAYSLALSLEGGQTLALDGSEPMALELARRGPQGPPGLAGGASIARQASTALSGHRAVRERADGAVEYADPSTPLGLTTVLGITSGAASGGAHVTIVTTGEMEEQTWSWTPGALIYLGASGALTQTAPVSGWLMVLGVATSATSMIVRIAAPIQLA